MPRKSIPWRPVEQAAFFATCPKGLEELLRAELVALGAKGTRLTTAGVSFGASWTTTYRILIWSRLASRVLHPLADFEAASSKDVYRHVRRVDWSQHLHSQGTIAVDAHVSGGGITHSHYAAQTVKDAIADQFRARFGERPSVDRRRPDLRLNLRIKSGRATLSLDLAGASLHQRGYRQSGGTAPLKEHLAAALVQRAGWLEIAARGGSFVDPCCGSGTLLIEAAMMATHTAPGLLRQDCGLSGWKKFDAPTWHRLIDEAKRGQRLDALEQGQKLLGYDRDPNMVAAACDHVRRAGLEDVVRIACRDLHDVASSRAPHASDGLVLCNPPYGERLGTLPSVVYLHARLGALFTQVFSSWRCALFSGRPALAKLTGLKADKSYRFFNGALPCQLLIFTAHKQALYRDGPADIDLPHWGTLPIGSGADRFRLHLEERHRASMDRASQSEDTDPLYASDLPDYPVTISVRNERVTIAATEPQDSRSLARLHDVLLLTPMVLGVAPHHVATEFVQETPC